MNTRKIGIVGFGSRGMGLAKDGEEVSGGVMKVTAVVEPDETAYKKGCHSYGRNPVRYPSLSKMISVEDLDGLLISSPNACHFDNLRECEGYSIPIFLEKPLDATFRNICDVVRFARSYKGTIVVGHCMRYAPILQEAKKLIQKGIIGRISSVRFVQNCYYGNGMYHGWRRIKRGSGSMFIEKATHDFDIMLWLIEANPVNVFALGKLHAFGGNKPNDLRCRDCDERITCPESIQNIMYRSGHSVIEGLKTDVSDLCVYASEVDVPDDEMCMTLFDSGVIGSYAETYFTSKSFRYRVYTLIGDLGAMEIDLGARDHGEILVCPRFGSPEDTMKFKFDYLGRIHYNGDGNMMKHFYQLMCGSAEPQTTVEQAFMAEALGYAASMSVEEKELIKIIDIIPEDLRYLLGKDIWITVGKSSEKDSFMKE